MKKLVIDIETVGTPWEELDAYVREYLIKGLNDGDAEETRRAGGLSPFRGRIIAIGVINIEDGRSCAMYEVPGQTQLSIEKSGQRTYISGSEKQILEKFWEFFEGDSRFITFNGRQFDGPFLMIRSAINGIVPKRDLVGYRYGFHPNCDLREVLNFFGTTNARQFKFNLDLACKVFGVETSKGEGLDGRSVETWYRAGRHREIADYCLDDVRATCELYEKVAPSLLIFNKEFREAEERARRRFPLIENASPLIPTSEASFIESVTQSSLELIPALEATPEAPAAVTSLTRAIVLEKLVQKAETEEDIPTGIDEASTEPGR
ncbi:MAG TPA: ribonuclease H-like domain-containing protein [Thermoanaerobaculia bacterium]|jgi:predicted PolB exonuclease-like 3'-5' exonuclease|nr:ribonuclease H-like domain-containing protein [Thermoanaerobaculia bacterium]